MLLIKNESAFIISPSAQQAIRNGATNSGIAEVVAVYQYSNDDDPIFDIYDIDENYLFSIDTDGDVIFEK